jgi:3'-phosphoadenosine 5'-phosphosulfate (PAPS) 3'-phosphatase
MTKDQKQLYTNVDLVAQAIFEKSIKRVYPEIEIIGEENLDEPSAQFYLNKEKKLISHYAKNESFNQKLEENLEVLFNDTKRIILNKDDDVKKKPFANFEQHIKNRKVKILLDPLDATYSFVNKNYNEATILAGVLVNNKPYLGTITSPFYNYLDNDKTAMVTYFNIPNHGIFSLKSEKSQIFDNIENFQIDQVRVAKKEKSKLEYPNELKLIVSRTREEKLKQILKPLVSTNVIKNLHIKTDNGMGYRSIKMIEEGYYFMTVKSCLGFWDLCATDAIFRELGGGCLSLAGKEIDYSKAGTKEVFPYDIMIGDDDSNLNYYLQHYKLLCE